MYGMSIADGAKRVCRGFKNDQFKQKFTLKKSKNFKSYKIEDPFRYDCSAYCQDHFYVWHVIADGAKRVCRGFKNDQFKQKFTLKKSKNFKIHKIEDPFRYDCSAYCQDHFYVWHVYSRWRQTSLPWI